MAIEAADLVKGVMECLSVSSPAELAERMGWKRGTERLVARWIAGDVQPGYGYTLELLEAAGWLSMNVDGRVSSGIPRDPLAEIAATVSALSDGQKLLLEHFGLGESLPVAPSEKRRVGPKQKQAKGR